jgi:putative membrane protein
VEVYAMFMSSLIVSTAIIALPQPQTPPRPTPEPTPPPPVQEPAGRTADKVDAGQSAGVPAADAAFVKKAAAGGHTEVAIAKLAQEKAEHADVKAFAAKLEKDHTAANTELKELAAQKKIMLAEAKTHGPVHAKLEKLSGAAFDRAFVAAMVDDHRKDVKAFEKAASGSGDSDIKAFAAKTLPTLKEHLQQVQELSKTVAAKKPTS